MRVVCSAPFNHIGRRFLFLDSYGQHHRFAGEGFDRGRQVVTTLPEWLPLRCLSVL